MIGVVGPRVGEVGLWREGQAAAYDDGVARLFEEWSLIWKGVAEMGSVIAGMVGHLDCYDIPCVQTNTTDAATYLMLVVMDSDGWSLVGQGKARSCLYTSLVKRCEGDSSSRAWKGKERRLRNTFGAIGEGEGMLKL